MQKKEKKEWIERKIKEVNETNRERDTRKYYKDDRNLTNPSTAMTLVYEDKDGNTLSGNRQIMERWQHYFKELLNPVITRRNNINMKYT